LISLNLATDLYHPLEDGSIRYGYAAAGKEMDITIKPLTEERLKFNLTKIAANGGKFDA
jgi:hypothetical protein